MSRMEIGKEVKTEYKCIGVIRSLHMHPLKPGKPLERVPSMTWIDKQGIQGTPKRTYDHRPERQKVGEDPNHRHVSFIHCGEIRQHEQKMHDEWDIKKGVLSPGRVRANVEFDSDTISPSQFISLINVEAELIFGKTHDSKDAAIIRLTEPRVPCRQMDRLVQGLQANMANGKVGLFGRVIQTGSVKDGTLIWCNSRFLTGITSSFSPSSYISSSTSTLSLSSSPTSISSLSSSSSTTLSLSSSPTSISSLSSSSTTLSLSSSPTSISSLSSSSTSMSSLSSSYASTSSTLTSSSTTLSTPTSSTSTSSLRQ